ncbi:MAG: hypothetical protein E4H23_10995, partial [Chrysiogenales bacterium]
MKKNKSAAMTRRNFMILGCGALSGLHAIRSFDPQQAVDSLPDAEARISTGPATRVALVRGDNRKAGV